MHEDKLVKRIEQGDISAADELIKLYYPEILRYCIWHAPNRTLAEKEKHPTVKLNAFAQSIFNFISTNLPDKVHLSDAFLSAAYIV